MNGNTEGLKCVLRRTEDVWGTGLTTREKSSTIDQVRTGKCHSRKRGAQRLTNHNCRDQHIKKQGQLGTPRADLRKGQGGNKDRRPYREYETSQRGGDSKPQKAYLPEIEGNKEATAEAKGMQRAEPFFTRGAGASKRRRKMCRVKGLVGKRGNAGKGGKSRSSGERSSGAR